MSQVFRVLVVLISEEATSNKLVFVTQYTSISPKTRSVTLNFLKNRRAQPRGDATLPMPLGGRNMENRRQGLVWRNRNACGGDPIQGRSATPWRPSEFSKCLRRSCCLLRQRNYRVRLACRSKRCLRFQVLNHLCTLTACFTDGLPAQRRRVAWLGSRDSDDVTVKWKCVDRKSLNSGLESKKPDARPGFHVVLAGSSGAQGANPMGEA